MYYVEKFKPSHDLERFKEFTLLSFSEEIPTDAGAGGHDPRRWGTRVPEV